MKDIDFDELDRAVSSLMNDVPKADPPRNDDVKTSTLSSDDQAAKDYMPETPVDSAVAADDSEAQDRPILVTSSAPAMPAARRGRFMDMVRPPAREARKQVSLGTVSRSGTTLQPVSSSTRPPIVGNPVRFEPAVTNDLSASTDLSTEPNDFEQESSATNIESTSAALGVSDTSFSQPLSEQPPMVSPFLPDAKVEKRPLGRTEDTVEYSVPAERTSSDSEISMVPAGVVGDDVSKNPDAQLPEQPLPAELDSKLLDIETSTASMSSEPSGNTSVEVKSLSRTGSSASGASPSLATTSIPQQYKVQPKVADASASRTIYDTASYHQPLSHPPKKKPGWLWVVAIIVILLLGAACGAVAYYLGLV